MSPERIPALETRVAELERRVQRFEDRELPAKLDVLNEQVRATRESFTAWQERQDALLSEVYDSLKTVVVQTAESRGSVRTRKAIVGGAVIAIGILISLLALALQSYGVFGALG